jgi:hypothetical protein
MNLKSYPKKSIKTPLQIQNHEYTKITILFTIILLKLNAYNLTKLLGTIFPLSINGIKKPHVKKKEIYKNYVT